MTAVKPNWSRQTQGWTREETERWWREEWILPHKGPDGKATTYALTEEYIEQEMRWFVSQHERKRLRVAEEFSSGPVSF